MSNKDKEKAHKKEVNPYLKYSGLAFEMLAVIGISVFVGNKLDQYFNNETPWITLIMVFVFLGGYLYKLVVDLSKK